MIIKIHKRLESTQISVLFMDEDCGVADVRVRNAKKNVKIVVRVKMEMHSKAPVFLRECRQRKCAVNQ